MSSLSKSKANMQSNDIIDKIVNDRDVYTHALKEKAPILNFDELGAVVYYYKTLFSILSLEKWGWILFWMRKTKFDRYFLAYYEKLLALK